MRIRHALVFALLFLAVSARAAELAPPSSGAPESTVEQKAEMPVPSAGDTGSGGPEAPTGEGQTAGEKGPGSAGKELVETGVPPVPMQGESPPAPIRSTPAPGTPGFLVKFNNADIFSVIHTLARIAGINYLVDPRVRGVVNIQTQGTVRKEGALDLLFSVLRVNGATAVLEGDLYHIIPMAESKLEPLPFSDPGGPEDALPAGRAVMQAFPLQYIAAADMAKVIKPFVSTGGDAVEVPRANMVLVVDTAANMAKHARMVELFDADAFRSARVRIFPLQYVDPGEMADNLDKIFSALDFSSKQGRPAGINFVPIPRLNALLVVSASTKTMENLERWIGELDREPTSTSRAVRRYHVKNGKAKDIADILAKLFPERATAAEGKPTQFRPKVAEAVSKTTSSPGVRIETTAAKGPEGQQGAEADGKGLRGGKFDIILDEPTNSLIIRGSASEYAAVLDILKAVDVYPQQVLLEVLIGEVQLDDALRLGIDWNYMGTSHGGKVSQEISLVTSAAELASGLKYAVEKTNRLTAAFRALANDGKVSVLSSPSVIAVNGKKSKIEVADSVPIVTASIVANSNPPVTTQTVEYRDVGVLLTFTPYINDGGIVTLEIEQEVSEVSTTVSTATDNPSFFKRNIQTTLIATQDRSIVLGGLVKERKSRSREGLPFLYKIPVIGWLFGARSDSVSRTELLIFITPRVISSIDEGTNLSREFEERVQELKRRIGEAKGVRQPTEK